MFEKVASFVRENPDLVKKIAAIAGAVAAMGVVAIVLHQTADPLLEVTETVNDLPFEAVTTE